MKENMKRLAALILALAMVLSLAACGSSSSDDADDSEDSAASEESTEESAEEESEDTDDGEPIYGGTLTTYYTEFYSEYDPSAYNNRSHISFIYDMLWNIDWSIDRDEFDYSTSYINSDYITGQLAESWEIADDYSSMTVYLRQDVYFQDKSEVGMDDEYDIYDGRQLVASDVKWSYDRLLGLDGAELVELDMTTWTTDLAMLESVEVVDDFTVIFYFNTTDEVSISDFMCAFVSIAGPEWDELTDEQKVDWHYAAGTGPFILTDYVSDNSMTFTRNPNYFDTDEDGNQLPYLDEVVLVYMTDSSTVLASFISGELDTILGTGVLDSDQITQLKASLSEDEYVEYTYTGAPIGIALKQGTNGVEALSNQTVREAMQYAIDIEAISTYLGYSYESIDEALSGVFASGTAWCDLDNWGEDLIESYTTYDPDKAMELLAEAGYEDGFEFDCYIFSMLNTDVFTLAAEYLNAVGITMNLIVGTTPSDMTSVGTDADDPGCAFYNMSVSLLTTLYSNILGTGDYIAADNEEIESLCNAVLDATTLDEQIAAAKELDVAYMSEHYILYLTYNELNHMYYRSYVKGLSGEKITCGYYYGFMAARMWIDET